MLVAAGILVVAAVVVAVLAPRHDRHAESDQHSDRASDRDADEREAEQPGDRAHLICAPRCDRLAPCGGQPVACLGRGVVVAVSRSCQPRVPSGPAGAGRCRWRSGHLLAWDPVHGLRRVGVGQLGEGDQVAVHVQRVQVELSKVSHAGW